MKTPITCRNCQKGLAHYSSYFKRYECHDCNTSFKAPEYEVNEIWPNDKEMAAGIVALTHRIDELEELVRSLLVRCNELSAYKGLAPVKIRGKDASIRTKQQEEEETSFG